MFRFQTKILRNVCNFFSFSLQKNKLSTKNKVIQDNDRNFETRKHIDVTYLKTSESGVCKKKY